MHVAHNNFSPAIVARTSKKAGQACSMLYAAKRQRVMY